jgi:hypothetical protein
MRAALEVGFQRLEPHRQAHQVEADQAEAPHILLGDEGVLEARPQLLRARVAVVAGQVIPQRALLEDPGSVVEPGPQGIDGGSLAGVGVGVQVGSPLFHQHPVRAGLGEPLQRGGGARLAPQVAHAQRVGLPLGVLQ